MTRHGLVLRLCRGGLKFQRILVYEGNPYDGCY
jgi:hypothetical protein